MYKHNQLILDDFETYVDDIWDDVLDQEPDRGLIWSHELGLSASMYMEDLDGCPVWQPNILDDGNQHEYL